MLQIKLMVVVLIGALIAFHVTAPECRAVAIAVFAASSATPLARSGVRALAMSISQPARSGCVGRSASASRPLTATAPRGVARGGRVRLGRAAQSLCDDERDVMVARQRLQRGVALHASDGDIVRASAPAG